MYPRKIDTGAGQQNVNLSLNWAIPADAAAARTACMAHPASFNYTVDITHHNSLEWLRNHVEAQKQQQQQQQQQREKQPFFLYEAFTVPHAGGWDHAPGTAESGAPVPTDGTYASHTAWPEVERDHAAVITYLDGYVGELVAEVKALGIEEDTVIFFASVSHSLTLARATRWPKAESVWEACLRIVLLYSMCMCAQLLGRFTNYQFLLVVVAVVVATRNAFTTPFLLE